MYDRTLRALRRDVLHIHVIDLVVSPLWSLDMKVFGAHGITSVIPVTVVDNTPILSGRLRAFIQVLL